MLERNRRDVIKGYYERQGVGDIHYSHYDYLDEQREAFEAWAKHVEKLVGGLHG